MSLPLHRNACSSSTSTTSDTSKTSAAIKNRDLLALRAFVTAKDANAFDDVADGTVLLDLTHSNLLQRHIEIRFDLHLDTLTTLRHRIYQKTGTPPHVQHLQIMSSSSASTGQQEVLWDLPPSSCTKYENHPLGFFHLYHGMRVHCIDLDPYSQSRHGGYENVDLVPKFVLTDEEYDQRTNTLRHWKRQQQLLHGPDFTYEKHAQQYAQAAAARMEVRKKMHQSQELSLGMQNDSATNATAPSTASQPSQPPPHQVGQRCEVQPGGRRGIVRFVGIIPNMGTNTSQNNHTTNLIGGTTTSDEDSPRSTTFCSNGSYWIGVEFDEPVGKSDGTFQGKRYFDVPSPRYGGFCRPHNVQVGDFPVRDLFDDDDDENNEEEFGVDDDGHRQEDNNDEDEL